MSALRIRKRPKYLDFYSILFSIKLPLPGKLSILHRVSGVGLFLLLAPLLWLFQASVTSPESFACFAGIAAHPCTKLLFAGIIWAFLHHFCAGIRFLFLDLDVGVDLAAARRSAVIVFVVSLALTALICWRVLL
ncbi:MAG: succinate dehydrogenase, cytochrome b556 subunit [Zoogloeaceae bacterium]|nr:succinate dehydrogenase, cytochrome b556 subunit [Zoogloeaceae bacterium]